MINLYDFGNSNVVADQIIADSKKRLAQKKWWNKIIPKIEEGQIIPNGISYKYWRNNFKLMLRIYKLRINLSCNYYPSVNDYLKFESRIKKPSFGFGFSCQYN